MSLLSTIRRPRRLQSTFQGRAYLIWATNRLTVLPGGNALWNVCSGLPKSAFREHRIVPSQTIFEGRTNQPSATHPRFGQTCLFTIFPNISTTIYPSQTKILEIPTNTSDRIFKALFNGQSPKWSTHVCEKCFENTVRNVCSAFQNLRLGSIQFVVPNWMEFVKRQVCPKRGWVADGWWVLTFGDAPDV
jgi:hypothetical protein